MSATHDLERRIADFYTTEAPDRAPAWVLTRALDTIESTPQRGTRLGRPWKMPTKVSIARLSVAAVAVVAVSLVGLSLVRLPAIGPTTSAPASHSPSPSSPSPSPSVRPSPSAGYSRFDSPTNGISIDYPSGWTARAATEHWGGKIAFDAHDVDVIFDPTLRGDLYLAVVSEPLGLKAPRDWVLDHTDSPSLGICYSGGAGGIGDGFQGNPAWFQECRGPTGGDGHIVIFSTPTRGYIVYLHVANEPSLQATYDEPWFSYETGLLKTVEVRPDEALDDGPLSSSSSPESPSTERPSPSAGYSRYDSAINRISIDYWSGWQTRPATQAWTGGPLGFDSPAADVIFDPSLPNGLYLLVASMPFSDISADAWKGRVLAWTCPGDGAHQMWGWHVDGVYSWQQGPCNSGSIIATDTRGYLIRVVASSDVPGLTDEYDWEWLTHVLETVDLRPEDPIDPPSTGAPVPQCADIAAGATYRNRFGTPRLAATVPVGAESVWRGSRDDFDLGDACPLGESIRVIASMVDAVNSDPCDLWSSPVKVRTPKEAVEAIVAQPGRRTSEPTEITIAGHAALRLEIMRSPCTAGIGLWSGVEFATDWDAILYLVDMDGDTLAIGVWYVGSETTPAQRAEAEAIVASIQVEKP